MTQSCLTRRSFLQSAAAGLAVPSIIPADALGRAARRVASDRINLGIVGLGSRGFNLIDAFLGHPEAQIVAVCDVDELHYRDRQWGKGTAYGRKPAQQKIEQFYSRRISGARKTGLSVCSDFREIVSRDDIDAVVVATPDHWHALCTLAALRAGKDVYCEKPVTHFFHEGQMVYREVASHNAVFQTGSQQRSDNEFRQAVELVMNGHIGKVNSVQVGLPPGYERPMGDAAVKQPPEHLDYDFWCGPAPVLPYMRARHHRWWRGHRAYGGGVLMDWIGHHNDIAHWALGVDRSGPLSVAAIGWTFPETSVYDTPHHYEIRCEYASGTTTSISSRHPVGTKFVGEDGWIFVNRGRLHASDPRWTALDFERGPRKIHESTGHTQNFLDCIKTRRDCIAPAETAHRSITPGHLGYVSQSLGRAIRWDAKTEQAIGDDDANRLLQTASYREPWKLEA